MDSPVICNKDFPLRCNGWHYLPTVEYCLENNSISHKDMKYILFKPN